MLKRPIGVDNHQYNVDYPDSCPICHHHGEISVVNTSTVENGTGVQVVYQCAWKGCKSYFIGYYPPKPGSELKALKPIKPQISQFPEAVAKLSTTFISVFQEAEEAAALGLSQIAGPGYRKAFEFLIKDYAKSLAPDKAADIEKSFSGAVVNDYVQDPRIQAVAKRSLWLGNDETHYLRKWTAHDVSDLVTLIKLAVNWIEIEQLSKSYISGMPD